MLSARDAPVKTPLLFLLADAGSVSTTNAVPPAPTTAPTPGSAPVAGAFSSRPYGLHVPKGWDKTQPVPLVVFFHGYSGNGAAAVALLGLPDLADAQRFVLAFPDGTPDAEGRRFWNATNACCDLANRGVDDVGYARWLLDDVTTKLPIDPKRIYVMGHSNGGFLALRLACELSPRIAAAVSLAGAAWKDDTKCRPKVPVSVLQIQGDNDQVVQIGGGLLFGMAGRDYPPAAVTVGSFAQKDRCTGTSPPGAPFDLDWSVPGPETRATDYTGCPPGISVSLWTVAGGSHFVNPTPAGLKALWGWMQAHPKP